MAWANSALQTSSRLSQPQGYQHSYSPAYLWQRANASMSTQPLCFQVPNPEVGSKKENKENKGSINSMSVVSCRCVKYYRWRLYWLYSSLSALNAFSLSCPQLTCMIGYLLSENFLKVIFLQFDQGDRRDVVENVLFFIYLEGKPLGFLSVSWTLILFFVLHNFTAFLLFPDLK